jgi:lysylphosphatidylglycerol synthetase-like protein (DUF2156 family)
MESDTIIALVTQWGHAVSLGVADHRCRFFQVPGIEGVIGYRSAARCAVVCGNPVCHPQDIPTLMDAFDGYCKENHYRIIYMAVTEACLPWALAQKDYAVLEVCSEIILNPLENPRLATGRQAGMLRNKYNQSVRNGIVVTEYIAYDEQIEQALESLALSWLSNRPRRQLYLYSVSLFTDRAYKRWFYAEYKERIVGLIFMNRLDAHQGWVLNISMLAPDAPKTTSEFMVMSVLDILAQVECSFFSIGVLPEHHVKPIQGVSRSTRWIIHHTYPIIQKLFALGERQRYWNKFQPRREPSFLLLDSCHMGPRELYALVRAFNIRLF